MLRGYHIRTVMIVSGKGTSRRTVSGSPLRGCLSVCGATPERGNGPESVSSCWWFVLFELIARSDVDVATFFPSCQFSTDFDALEAVDGDVDVV